MELALEILKESLHFHEFCLQEPRQVLTVKTSENSPHTSSREREKVTISKYAQSILFFNKVLASKETILSELKLLGFARA